MIAWLLKRDGHHLLKPPGSSALNWQAHVLKAIVTRKRAGILTQGHQNSHSGWIYVPGVSHQTGKGCGSAASPNSAGKLTAPGRGRCPGLDGVRGDFLQEHPEKRSHRQALWHFCWSEMVEAPVRSSVHCSGFSVLKSILWKLDAKAQEASLRVQEWVTTGVTVRVRNKIKVKTSQLSGEQSSLVRSCAPFVPW